MATAMLPDVGDAAECEEENEVLAVSKLNIVPSPWTMVIQLQQALRILQSYIVPCTLHIFYTVHLVHCAFCTLHNLAHCRNQVLFWIKGKPIRLEYHDNFKMIITKIIILIVHLYDDFNPS